MPTKSGISHGLAALVVLLISPYLKYFSELVVSTQDIVSAVERTAEQLARHPDIPLTSSATATMIYIILSFLLMFIWGYAYHYQRHE